ESGNRSFAARPREVPPPGPRTDCAARSSLPPPNARGRKGATGRSPRNGSKRAGFSREGARTWMPEGERTTRTSRPFARLFAKPFTIRRMNGLMMEYPLTLSTIFRHAEALFGRQEIVTRRPDKSLHRYTYADFTSRARRFAAALQSLGVVPGDRVATLGWNHYQHLEAYFAIPLM